MLPEQFFKLTIVELFDMVAAYYQRKDEEGDEHMKFLAWQTSHLMNSTGNYKKNIKPKDLYSSVGEAEDSESVFKPVERDLKNRTLAELQSQFKK
ncbi:MULTISPECIES: hypothetical protein [unclassified Exiguobacterium]|uniref:hypothetical protein n=1 Tax=unclassified Exiguobacterium TaxID=2644629 RepID=UPI001BE90E54|nr:MULTISPECIES: hypothetical protein [unclassified Exiguobacterium]